MFTPEQALGEELSLLISNDFPKKQMSFESALYAQSILNDIILFEKDKRGLLEKEVEKVIDIIFPVYRELKDDIEFRLKLSDSVKFKDPKKKNAGSVKLDQKTLNRSKTRKTMNMFIHGAAMNTHGIHHMSDLISSDKKIVKMYDDVMSINTDGIYSTSVTMLKVEHTSGRVEVYFENGKWIIEVEALIFPVLVHESIKGIFELIMLSSMQDWGKDVIEDVYSVTDSIFDEVIDIRYGNILYSKYRDYINDVFQKEIEKNPILIETSLKTLMLRDIDFISQSLVDVLKNNRSSEKMSLIVSDCMK